MAQLADKRLALEHGLILDSPVNLKLDNVPWDLAIDPLLSSRRLQAHLVDDIIVVTRARGRPGSESIEQTLRRVVREELKAAV